MKKAFIAGIAIGYLADGILSAVAEHNKEIYGSHKEKRQLMYDMKHNPSTEVIIKALTAISKMIKKDMIDLETLLKI